MRNNKIWILILITSGFYFLLDLLLHDAFLYIIGGVLGTLLKSFDKQVNLVLLVLLWLVLLAASIVAFYKISNKSLKYFMLVVVAILLHEGDFILYGLLPYNIVDAKSRYLTIGIMVLTKAIILSLIIYFDRKQRTLIAKRLSQKGSLFC